ncbi:haloalkane dehalogenase [Coxiella burnetii]|uniref:haloalkane dehalogenase n=1 Tax=Coxiella burnetii TaxID=777 RepID=UPI0000ED0336|nr:haloalkane dehalogenase [Coxiella burnetii]ACJ20284.1 1,3,4,6-tetrachloro-1,4-cyclohexadiene hydrolase [Coxiella burnetii CbuK_Q154]EAX31939.3 haloalkane dehalogenase [Coxiella burnetii 'MSU Goat Q177']UYK69005.1 haloalkane dehalogenase [Coxiella burnetii]
MIVTRRVCVMADYASRFVTVKGAKMHYIETGQGEPVLFIHGMPTSSYLWRNIIPKLADKAHCVALDLIGMGESDKPDIDYTVNDHISYVECFIEALGLRNITLVMHGWGSVIGFDYARRHPKNIKALAFFESHIRPTTDWDMLSLPVQQLATLLHRPGASYRAIVEQNYLINKLLPASMMRKLSDEEMANYRRPFLTKESRKPLWQYLQDLPLGDSKRPVVKLIKNYSQWLKQAPQPKLMMYAVPGFVTTMATVQWAKEHLPNLTLVEFSDVLHFAQESIPDIFSEELRKWYLNEVRSVSFA